MTVSLLLRCKDIRQTRTFYADVAWPLERMSYGTQEFGIVDCNGYTLAFAQDGQVGRPGDA